MAVSKTNQDGQDRSENSSWAGVLKAGQQTARILEDALFHRLGKSRRLAGVPLATLSSLLKPSLRIFSSSESESAR